MARPSTSANRPKARPPPPACSATPRTPCCAASAKKAPPHCDWPIGSTIDRTEGLRQRLDDLDGTPNNVAVTSTDGIYRYDVRIERTIAGSAELAIDGAPLDANSNPLGRLALAGSLDASLDLAVHVVFGVDQYGFFIDTAAQVDEKFGPVPRRV
jgi:hypothetical protein